jgi:hypothetical protein
MSFGKKVSFFGFWDDQKMLNSNPGKEIITCPNG